MADLSAFNDYERDFLSLTSPLPTRINTLLQHTGDADSANSELRKIEMDVTTARQRLTDMEMEARGISEPTKRELGNKIRMYKDSLSSISSDLRRAKEKVQRQTLMGASTSGRPMTFDKSMDSRTEMQATTDKLRQGNDILDDTHRRLEETVDVGTGIMGELARNRETLGRIRGNVGVVSGTMDEARRIIRGMAKREVRNKIALGVFAVVLIGIIIGMIVWIVQKK